MKYMQVNADASGRMVLGAGVLCTGFNPATGAVTGLIGLTSGGTTFDPKPTYQDWAEDIDQIPDNTKEFKRLIGVDPTLSGTFLEVSDATAKLLAGAATNTSGHIVPRDSLESADFTDIWWVGDYSDVNSGDDAGYMSIHLKNALNTSGFQIQAQKNDKGRFAFEFHGHYTITDISDMPYEIYIKQGENEEEEEEEETGNG